MSDYENLHARIAQLVERNAGLGKEVDRLNGENASIRAEIAGLKTGYKAYEQLNAELRAEVNGLRKDAERYRWLRDAKGLSLRSDGSKWTRSNGEQFICSHHLCAFDTSYAPFESLDEVVDNAISSPENPS